MTKFASIAVLGLTALGLSACNGINLGDRDRPDEFAVQRQAPLVIPPDFHLVPPAPGAPRPVEGTASQQALDALFGGPAQRSAVETRTLQLAGQADPGIRSTVGDGETYTVDTGSNVQSIIAAPEGDGQAGRAVIPE
ncbi:DUF3035 domain-containing protein [Erythrobacter arachoides]|uniref:DUF3035 domain-containing protein n=1 Tax=Aurantiacibacter arachoides TaxID=1850444 RepID=A0A845A3N5_9SPHN|nr:DUF3035 domain-containing protein [Aurantiacibacter arachoides]MXO94715.1 DUF3035 domain-containing protein [Aurantiacibacter arachoides]GGD61221.1 hypothetical protein GCM10011411_21860 [Aurantiacibacter arachoides]